MNDIVQQQNTSAPPAEIPSTSTAALILSEASMAQIERVADIMAKGRSTVPQHLQNNKGDCAAVVMQAMQWGMNPFAVAQKTHVVNGQLGYEAQLVNAVISTSGALTSRPEYEWFGPWENIMGKFAIKKKPASGTPGTKDYKKETEYRVPGWTMADEKGCGVRVWATLKGEEVPRYLELHMEQASVRNSPLWASDPKQQLAYLAVKRWSRLYCPDVILGVYTPDELEPEPMRDLNDKPGRNARPQDVAASKRQQAPAGPSPALLAAARAAADKGREAFAEWWRVAKPADRGALRDELPDLESRVRTAEENKVIDMPTTDQQQADENADFVRGMDASTGESQG